MSVPACSHKAFQGRRSHCGCSDQGALLLFSMHACLALRIQEHWGHTCAQSHGVQALIDGVDVQHGIPDAPNARIAQDASPDRAHVGLSACVEEEHPGCYEDTLRGQSICLQTRHGRAEAGAHACMPALAVAGGLSSSTWACRAQLHRSSAASRSCQSWSPACSLHFVFCLTAAAGAAVGAAARLPVAGWCLPRNPACVLHQPPLPRSAASHLTDDDGICRTEWCTCIMLAILTTKPASGGSSLGWWYSRTTSSPVGANNWP